MKRNLLTMALAMVFGVGAYAFETGQYIYTKDAKLKVTDATNKITNGNYSQTDGWTSENGGALAANWLVTTATKDDAQVTVLQSEGATNDEGTHLTNAWVLPTGIYALSYWVYSPSEVTTSITAGGNNVVSFYVSADGTTVARQINATTKLAEAAWTQVTDTIQVNSESETVWFKASQVAQGIQFTDFQLVTVKSVYDTRIAERELAYAKQILEDANFKTDYAIDEGFYDELAGAIETIEQMIANNQMETETTAATYMNGLTDYLADYMDASTVDLASNLEFIGITDIGNYSRDGIKSRGCFEASGNWGHLADTDYLMSAIQNSYNQTPKIAVKNTSFPAGKYFFTAEIRNANTNSQTWPCEYIYNLETSPTVFVGENTLTVPSVSGEEYTRVYLVGDIAEDGAFSAGVQWPEIKGGACFIKNIEVRSFDKDVKDKAAHVQAWADFKEQYDVMVSNRAKAESLVNNAEYPWSQGVLNDTLTKWNPLYDAEVAKGWVAADGTDAGVASTEDLKTWVKQQGQDPEAEGYRDYPIVRAYQYAYDKVVAANKVFKDLAADIVAAIEVRDDDMNATGDKTTFQTAIDAATATHDNLMASTTDETMKADSTALDQARKDLAAAVEAFKASAVLEPIIDIDFSNSFEAVMEGEDVMGYVIKGAKGQMDFTAAQVDIARGNNTANYELGAGEGTLDGVLRVGSSNATVALAESDIPTDNDVLRISFDYWGGYLVKSTGIDLQLLNAAGVKVAGIKLVLDRNGGWAEVTNDFNDAANNGLKFGDYFTQAGSSKVGNAGICTDANKTTFDLIVDYKAQTLLGNMVNGKKGSSNSNAVAIPAVEDNKIVKFSIGTAGIGTNTARRSWFDNLKIYKYASQAEGPAPVGIKNVKAAADNGAIYDLTGRRIVKAAKGLYIKNGKKYVIK